MNTITPCLNEFDRVVALCRRQAKNAAVRNKPTMWAYYERMAERLESHFSTAVAVTRAESDQAQARIKDGGIAGVALAILQTADERCPTLPRDESADLWALGTYCARILAVWTGQKPRSRRSLRWLKERAAA